MTVERLCALVLLAPVLWAGGCAASYGPRAEQGLTLYCPGVGNCDFGDAGLRRGLEAAGYRGEVTPFYWTIAPGWLGAPIDQLAQFNARLRAVALAREVERFIDEHPAAPINLVGLSAGSGVAIWALENLKPGYKVDSVVLLSSSLSCDYDVSKALDHVRGRLFCYYCPKDFVLDGPMRLTGTIDGKFADAAGLVGLACGGHPGRVVNIGWDPRFKDLGNHGGHTDATQPRFVQAQVAPWIMERATSESVLDGALAIVPDSALPGGPRP